MDETAPDEDSASKINHQRQPWHSESLARCKVVGLGCVYRGVQAGWISPQDRLILQLDALLSLLGYSNKSNHIHKHF